MVTAVGVQLGKEAVMELADCADTDTLEAVRDAAKDVPDVLHCTSIRARRCGPHTSVDLVAVVSPDLSVTASHHAAAQLRARVGTVEKVHEVNVHVVPPRVPELLPDVTNAMVEAELRLMCETASLALGSLAVSSITHHYLPPSSWWRDGGLAAEVAIVVPIGQTMVEVHRLAHELRKELEGSRVGPLQILRVDVRLDVGTPQPAIPLPDNMPLRTVVQIMNDLGSRGEHRQDLISDRAVGLPDHTWNFRL
jgi:hypothetical protein